MNSVVKYWLILSSHCAFQVHILIKNTSFKATDPSNTELVRIFHAASF